MIFFAKSIVTSRLSHFPHPLLTLLLSPQYGEVIYTNEWTGNLSVILFVAFFLSELNGKASTYQGGLGSPQENLKFSI